jgi:hypothetical protein
MSILRKSIGESRFFHIGDFLRQLHLRSFKKIKKINSFIWGGGGWGGVDLPVYGNEFSNQMMSSQLI